MADTFTAYGAGISLAATKSLLSVFNGVGSGVVIRVKRVFVLNTQIAAVTGVLGLMEVRAITAASGGTAITPTKHNTAAAALQAQVSVLTNGTVSNATNSLLARQAWSSDEPAVGGALNDEWQGIPAWQMIYEAGYGDTRVQPYVLREGYGLSVTTSSALTAGTADVRIEFTRAAT